MVPSRDKQAVAYLAGKAHLRPEIYLLPFEPTEFITLFYKLMEGGKGCVILKLFKCLYIGFYLAL